MQTSIEARVNRSRAARFRARHTLVNGAPMKELLRTNDPVRLSWVEALLRDAGIHSLVLDHHTSLVEGNIGAIPRRLMVEEGDYRRACALLAACEEGGE
jgi:Putative prokaryotic signal transducing protein